MTVFAEFTLPVTAFPPGAYLGSNPDVTVEHEGFVPTGSVTHYCWVEGGGIERFLDALRADSSVESVDVLDRFDERSLIRIRWLTVESPVLDLVEDGDAMLVEAAGTGEGWSVTVRFPDDDALTAFHEACRTRGITLELEGINESGLGSRDDGYGLTATQRETVAAAFEAGYFDVPRQVTLAELADRLDVSEQAVSERLRRGLGTFLVETLRGDESTATDDGD